MFPSLRAQGNIISNNVSATIFPRLPVPFMLMRLCLCLCASENSIRQISGFVLSLMLMLMSRVFSLAYACAYAYALVRTGLKLAKKTAGNTYAKTGQMLMRLP